MSASQSNTCKVTLGSRLKAAQEATQSLDHARRAARPVASRGNFLNSEEHKLNTGESDLR